MTRAPREAGRARGTALRIAVLLIAVVALAGALLFAWIRRAPPREVSAGWPDDARREVQSVVESRYVDPMTPEREERLFDAAMRGYVANLDPFSRYIPASDRAALDEEMSGTFHGIGVHFDAVPAGLLVTAVRRGGPADRAGVVPGETIERVGDVPLAGRGLDAMIAMIKGAEGTSVALWLRPAAGGGLRRADAVRAKVEADGVPAVRAFAGAPVAGYLRLSRFNDAAAVEARAALESLVADGAGAIVLDLRRNLGGVVLAAVDVASLFLPPDTLVCTSRSRDGSKEYRTRKIEGFEPVGLPLVVLVDESSASASEILAGALQDHGRAVLVGVRTYGKFVMQTDVPLPSRGAVVRLTTARYVTPRGRSDQQDPARGVLGGLMPDVLVPLASNEEERALAAAFARQTGPAWIALPGRTANDAAPDRQLAAALELVRGGAAPAEPVPPRTN